MRFLSCTKVSVALMSFVSLTVMVFGNIESGADGGYCVNKIPRRGVSAKCTSTAACEDLLGVVQTDASSIRCGDQGECLSKQLPRNEQCREACDGSPCGKFCLQEHETKAAMYCIETRDHPNAMPNNTVVPPNKYFCTCLLPEEIHRHRVVSRYLRYKLLS